MNDSPIKPPEDGVRLTAEELQIIMKGLVTMATPSRQSDAAKVIHAAIAREKLETKIQPVIKEVDVQVEKVQAPQEQPINDGQASSEEPCEGSDTNV